MTVAELVADIKTALQMVRENVIGPYGAMEMIAATVAEYEAQADEANPPQPESGA